MSQKKLLAQSISIRG